MSPRIWVNSILDKLSKVKEICNDVISGFQHCVNEMFTILKCDIV
jgi:hypothetical protein